MKDIKTNIPLPEVVWFQEGPGVRNTQYTISGVKLLNVANLVDGKIDLSTSDRYISEEEAYGRYKHFMADEGDLIIASSGIKVEYIDKKIGFIHKEHLPLCMNTSTIRFKVIDDKELNIKFFMYFLKSNEFKHQLFRHITGCAQLNFGPSHLKKMIISYPPLPEQSRIVEELDLLSNIIEKKRQQLSELDNLAQSIFYDMFGDPVTNEKGWEVKKLEDVCIKITDGTHNSPKNYSSGTYMYITAKNIKKDGFDLNNITYVLDDDHHSIYNRCNPMLGDVLYIKDGATTGIAMINTIQEEFSLLSSVALLKCNYMLISNIYMRDILNYPTLYNEIRKNMGGAAITRLTIKKIENIKIPLPPLSLQQLFAQKIEAIEKQKALIKQSIAETEELFNSRMDYYFS